MPKSDEARPVTARTMQKRVETKEDGRLLIYYTFETGGAQGAGAGATHSAGAGATQGSTQGLASGEPTPKKGEDFRK